MLSISAFNALLKTLEEPPSYVIFILATTEVHKIPITICPDARDMTLRISLDTIARPAKGTDRRRHISRRRNGLCAMWPKAADGSMRDAPACWTSVAAFPLGVSPTTMWEVLGAVDNSVFSQLFRAAVEGRTKDCISAIEIVIPGQELSQLSQILSGI